jgi:hypothetical protein
VKSSLAKIVSGGQTGVDRGALDAALDSGFPCGGWATHDRIAEDGRIPDRFPLVELAGAGYEERTLQNVLDSDGTIIIYFRELEGGTRLTMEYCVEHGKPFEPIDASRLTPGDAALGIAAFVRHNRIAVLNFAGPRASKQPTAYEYARITVNSLLQAIRR